MPLNWTSALTSFFCVSSQSPGWIFGTEYVETQWKHGAAPLFLDLISEEVRRGDTSVPSADPPALLLLLLTPLYPPRRVRLYSYTKSGNCLAFWELPCCEETHCTLGSRPAQSHETQHRPTPRPRHSHSSLHENGEKHTHKDNFTVFIHIVVVNIILVCVLDNQHNIAIWIVLKCIKMAPSPVKMLSKKKKIIFIELQCHCFMLSQFSPFSVSVQQIFQL